MSSDSDKWFWCILPIIPILVVIFSDPMSKNLQNAEISAGVRREVDQHVNGTIPGYRVVGYRKEFNSPCALNELGMTFVATRETEDGTFMKDHIVLGTACLKNRGTEVSSVHLDTNARR